MDLLMAVFGFVAVVGLVGCMAALFYIAWKD